MSWTRCTMVHSNTDEAEFPLYVATDGSEVNIMV
jgi:hypothetical protein